MAYFPHAYQKVLVADSFSTQTGESTIALTAGELAIVNAKTHTILDISGAGTYTTTPLVYLAQGSFHTTDKLGPFHGGYQESVKSKGINPKYVSKFYVTEPAVATNQIISIGCGDGTQDWLCGKTYRLRLDVKGSPALRFMTHNLYHTFDAYTGCCDDPETPIAVDPLTVLGEWSTQINAHPFISKFVSSSLEYFYKEGSSWVSYGSVKPDGTQVGTITIDAGGATYTNGTYSLVFTGGGGTGAAATATVAGGIVTAITITNRGEGYETAPTVALPGGAGAGDGNFAATVALSDVWSAVAVADKDVKIKLTGAYVGTTFGDCSFDVTDHVEYEPVQIYASFVDNEGDPCSITSLCVTEDQEAYQGKGYGDTLLKELILSKRYEQDPWQSDPRMREILNVTTLTEIDRTAKYYVYHILHSVPRSSNPSGTMDADQYLIKIVTSTRSANFESYFNELLSTAGNAVQLEVLL